MAGAVTSMVKQSVLDQPFSNFRKADGRKAQIGGDKVLRHPLEKPWAFLQKP